MEHSDIEYMAQGYPPSHIGKDCEEVITWLATKLLETQAQRDMYGNAEISWEKAMMGSIGEDGTGSVVRAIAELKAQRDALAAENVALKGFGDTLSEMHAGLEGSGTGFSGEHEAACQQMALDSAMDEFDAIKTPATDAYLNSVRAEGVEALTKILQAMIDAGDFAGDEIGAIAGAVDAGNYHAAQLRAIKESV